MAVTAAALQTALGITPQDAKITQELGTIGAYQHWYVEGNLDAAGRAKLIRTNEADNAATQDADILTQLRAN